MQVLCTSSSSVVFTYYVPVSLLISSTYNRYSAKTRQRQNSLLFINVKFRRSSFKLRTQVNVAGNIGESRLSPFLLRIKRS
jgi:hypothetical protein